MQKRYTLNVLRFGFTGSPSRKMTMALSLLFLFTGALCKHGYSQNLGWAKRLGGSDYEHAKRIVLAGVKKDDGTSVKKFIKQ